MKKLIQILFSLPIISAPIIGTVACSAKSNGEQPDTPEPDYSANVASLKFMSQLLLSGRHENMNFNINELLTYLITPQQGYGGIPSRFNYNGKVIDFSNQLNDYIGRLAPSLGSLEKNGSDVVGVYASYVMGMYNNDFYRNFQKNGYFDDTLSQDGTIGLFGKNNSNGKNKSESMTVLPGLNKNLKLADENSRKELAWGIQDNGPLSNFLLDNGYDGAPASTIANTGAGFTSVWDNFIKSGTNAGGYMFYNTNLTGAPGSGATKDSKYRDGKFISELSQDKIKEGSNNKLELASTDASNFQNSKLNINDGKAKGSVDFNEVGAKLGLFSGDAYKLNKISIISSLLSNINNTESGTNVLLKFLDTLLPIRDYNASSPIDVTTMTNTITSGTYMGFITDFYKTDDGTIKKPISDVLGDLDSEAKKPIGKYSDVNTGFFGLGGKGASLKVMFGDDTKNQSNALNQSQILINAIIKKYDKMSSSEKDVFSKKLCAVLLDNQGNEHNFIKNYSGLIGGTNVNLIGDVGPQINKINNKHNIINMLSFAGGMYKVLSDDAKISGFKKLVDAVNEMDAPKTADQVLITSLNSQNFNRVKKMLGIKNGKATKGSTIDSILNMFVLDKKQDASIGADVIKGIVSTVASGMDEKIKSPYKNILSHIVTNDDWKLSDPYENFTSVSDTNGVMSFTLDYKGVGDSSSNADKQTKKVNDSDLNNFNPYQTISKYFTEDNDFNKGFKYTGDASIWDSKRVSGKVLGKELLTKDSTLQDQALINYDGTGLLKNYKPVHHRYKVEWRNIGLENSPYWVMTKVDCFNVEGGKETPFYNIY